MSKERLDFDVEREMKHLKRIVNKDDSLTLSSRFVKYLIEQAEENLKFDWVVEDLQTQRDHSAERVQELDGFCIHCNGKGFNGLDYCTQCVKGKNLKLEQQNKCYREAIEKVLYETGDKVIQNILETALESESNESKRTSNRMG